MRTVAALLVTMLSVAAADAALVTADTRHDAGMLTLTVPTPGAVTKQLAGQLKDGLTHRVRYTLTVRADGNATPVLTDVMVSEVVYDLWDEVFIVSHTQGGRIRRVRLRSVERVKAVLEKPRFKALARAGALPDDRAYVADLFVEVNPVSQEVLRRTREMLSPPPRDSETGSARSFLGSVASIFVNEANTSAEGERLVFRTRPFQLPKRGGAK